MNINEWATRWNIPNHAINELLFSVVPTGTMSDETEGAVSAKIKLAASRRGGIMWRNNSGAVTLGEPPNVRHVRYGLGNISTKVNKEFKSSDLIGITPVFITPAHVGQVIGRFTASEVKRGNWVWSGSEAEQAQWKYLNVVTRLGGLGCFAKSEEDYLQCVNQLG